MTLPLPFTPFQFDEKTKAAHDDMAIAMRNGSLRALPTDFAPLPSSEEPYVPPKTR